MNKELLKKVILEQQKLFQKNTVTRQLLSQITQKKEGLAIIISGIRRCGKSVLLQQVRQMQKQQDYSVNFDDERLHAFTIDDFETLYEVLIELFGEQQTFYFDEIQNIDGWERFVRRLLDYNNQVYITGSNATLLSKELGTRLTGRYIQKELYPASFTEFLNYKQFSYEKNDLYDRNTIVKIRTLFADYLTQGGFFKYYQTQDVDFFKSLYDNIIYRDIVTRYSLSYPKAVKDIFYYLVSNIGKEYSYTTLKKIAAIANVTTIKEYIQYMENSYLLFSISLYDVSLKRQLINPKKVYVVDSALANSISFRFSEESGRILENTVFLQLKRLGKEIYYHRQKYECDFVIKEGTKISQAIQVCHELHDENKERELSGLLEACKTHKHKTGLLLTRDQEEEFIQEGIKIFVKPVWKWLLE